MEFLPLLFILGAMYFVLVRPQQKRQREREATLSKLAVGDDVVTIGGLHGRIEALTESTADLAIAEDETGDPVLLRFDRNAIARVVQHDAVLDDDHLALDVDDDVQDDLTSGADDADAHADRD